MKLKRTIAAVLGAVFSAVSLLVSTAHAQSNDSKDEGHFLPSGAIVAFDRDDCPPEWVDFNPADGRVLIGTGKMGDVVVELKSFGGELTHGHSGRTSATQNVSQRGDDDSERVVSISRHTHDFTTGKESNLPPYVGVRFCKKR